LPPQKRAVAGNEIEVESTAVFGRLEYQFVPRREGSIKETITPDSTTVEEGF
jgi:hypothetical protein